MTPIKREPSAGIRAGAAEMRELFVAWVDEGFTEEQAIQMMQAVLTANSKKD